VIAEDRSFLRAVLDGIFTVPGDGSIDFAAVLRELVPFGTTDGWSSRPSRIRRPRIL
jgi:sugar phosphate isomerase/epimerase